MATVRPGTPSRPCPSSHHLPLSFALRPPRKPFMKGLSFPSSFRFGTAPLKKILFRFPLDRPAPPPTAARWEAGV